MQKPEIPYHYALSDILGAPASEQDILDSLREAPECIRLYENMQETHRVALMNFLMGNRGLAITYDVIFKQLMDPYLHRNRLEDLLSAILKQRVRIRSILPLAGLRQQEEDSLVVMDITVELEDGSIIDVEMQKVGYYFPGQRADCYGSDFIMRQYNRLRNELGSAFTYRSMKPVILIVIMERSAAEFLQAAPHYIHRSVQSFDSGADIPTLFRKIFISLDTFSHVVQNINTEEDAWLTYLTASDPDRIVELVNRYPQFLDCYRELARFRQKPKEMITMYSEALAVADRNTVKFMIDDQKKQIEQLDQQIVQLDQQIEQLDQQIEQKDQQIEQKDQQIEQKDQQISEKDALIAQLQEKLKQYQQD